MSLKELFDKKRLKNDGNYSDDEIREVERTFSKISFDKKDKVIWLLAKEISWSYINWLSDWISWEVAQKNLNSLTDPNKKELLSFLKQKAVLLVQKTDEIDKITDIWKQNIAVIQWILLFLGYNRNNIKINWEFDEATFQALAQYQLYSDIYNYQSIWDGKVNFIITSKVIESLTKDLQIYEKNLQSDKKFQKKDSSSLQQNKSDLYKYQVSWKVISPQNTSRVGSIDVDPQKESQIVKMKSSELSTEILNKLNNAGQKEFAEKLEKMIFKKWAAYQLLWSLIQNDAQLFGDEKYYEWFSGWFRERSRALETAPIYFGKDVKNIIWKKQEDFSTALKAIYEAILKWDFNFAEQGFDYLDKYVFTMTDQEISSMIMNYQSNLWTPKYVWWFFISKDIIEKYIKKFDQWDVSSVFEFFSEVMKNQTYSDFMILGNTKTSVSTLDFFKNNFTKLQDKNTVNNFMQKQSITLFNKSFKYPSDIDYHNILEDYISSSKGKPNIDELMIMIKSKVLEKIEKQMLSSFPKNSQEYKLLNNFYNDRSFWTNLDRYWASYILKWLPLAVAAILVWAWVGIGSAALAWAVWVEWTLGTLGIWLAGQTLITTPVMTMVGWTLAGEWVSSTLDRLWDFDIWKESALYNTVFSILTPALGSLKNAIMSGKIWKTMASMQGSKFALHWVNLWSFVWEVGLNIWMDTLVFDGEFTPQEIVNATIFSLMNRAGRHSMIKKIWDEITFDNLLPPSKWWEIDAKTSKDSTKSKEKLSKPKDNPEDYKKRVKTSEKTRDYKIHDLESLTIQKIRANNEAENMNIIKRLEFLKKEVVILKEEVELSWNRDTLHEYQYKKDMVNNLEYKLKEALWVEKFTYLKEKNYLYSLDKITKDNINELNSMVFTMDRLYSEYLLSWDSNYISWEKGIIKKIYEYNQKIDMFKNIMWDEFLNVSKFLFNPVDWKHMKVFDDKIIPLKQAINILTLKWIKENDPQIKTKQEELSRELYNLRIIYGEKRIAEFMQSLNQRIERIYNRASWKQSQSEQNYSNSNEYRGKIERPESQKTPQQIKQQKIEKVSKMSLKQILDEISLLKRDIKKFLWNDVWEYWDIKVWINECKTTLEMSKKFYNANNPERAKNFYELWNKRIIDLQKCIVLVWEKVQDYFIYINRLKQIWDQQSIEDSQINPENINPKRFVQFNKEIDELIFLSKEIEALASNNNSKSKTDRIYAWF